jgi:acetyl-CoA carboxylase biotin carboxylase subunit
VLESVLVANRGEIARRVIATARRLGIRSVAVYSEADAGLPFVREADEAVLIGPPPPAQSYLDAGAILAAAHQTAAAAIHPGYGFLSENATFAQRVEAGGLTWVGPTPEAIEQMGDKINARNLMHRAGVPVALGSTEPVTDPGAALAEAGRIGYPVMVKAAAGGGGIGMSAANGPEELQTAFETARTRAERFFGSPAILLERFIERARHVEVQIMGLADGRVVALGERDCSVQRRHQKVAEETPSPGVGPQVREHLLAAGVRAGEAVGYRGAGTVEFLLDVRTQEFVFLEMNTRLYAEDPVRFLPSPGAITEWEQPAGPGIRVDAGYEAGNKVTPFYDPLLAKLCVHGGTRDEALGRAREAVAAFRVAGPKTNLPFHADLLANEPFVSGDYDTSVVAGLRP